LLRTQSAVQQSVTNRWLRLIVHNLNVMRNQYWIRLRELCVTESKHGGKYLEIRE